MANILFTASTTAFSPSGKLDRIAHHLRAKGHHIIFVGHQNVPTLKDDTFHQVWDIDPQQSNFKDRAIDLFRECDVVISVMNEPAEKLAHRLRLPVIKLNEEQLQSDSITEEIADSVELTQPYGV
jgi:hypothetical protein